MFGTEKSAEIPSLSVFLGGGYHIWRYVTLTMARPWFFVNIQLDSPDGEFTENLFLSDVRQLIDIQTQAKILDVQIATPGSVNNQGRWRMDPLHKVVCVESEHHEDQLICFYVLESGEVYKDFASTLLYAETKPGDVVFMRD